MGPDHGGPPSFDVVIVGGGPAGASTALHLVRAEGIAPSRILVVDKAQFPRDKPCAGAVSHAGIQALSALGVRPDVPQIVMRGLRVIEGARRAESQSVDLGVVVRRDEFDHALLKVAQADGVTVWQGAGLAELAARPGGGIGSATSGHLLALGDGRKARASILVAADGAGSTTRKLLKVPEAARKGHLYVLETDASRSDAGPVNGLCDFDFAPCSAGIEGYYWDFPTPMFGRTRVSRGIYHANFTPHKGLKASLEACLAERGVSVAQPSLRAFSTRPFVRKSVGGHAGCLFVGEAFGIDQATGEGIAQAIIMGGIAARHLALALRLGHLRLGPYEEDVRASRLGRHLLQSAWFAERVFSPAGAWYRAFLSSSPRAVEAGARWYRGDRVGTTTKARLATGLGRELLAAALRGRRYVGAG